MWFLLQRTPRRSTFEVGFLRKRSERQGTRSPIKAFGISIYIFVSKEDRSSRRFYLTMKRFHRSANSIYTSLHTGIVTKSTRKFANWKHASRWMSNRRRRSNFCNRWRFLSRLLRRRTKILAAVVVALFVLFVTKIHTHSSSSSSSSSIH